MKKYKNVSGNINDDADINTDDNADNNIETRHALSLQQPQNQIKKTIGQKRFQNQGKNTVSSIFGSYKSAVTKHAHRLGYDFEWQVKFYDHIIRDEKSYHRIKNYIKNNPKNWEDDKFYTK